MTLGKRIASDIHIPYWFVSFFRKNDFGLVYPVSNLTSDIILAKKVEKSLYGLHRDFKRLGIIKYQWKTVGTIDQFDHRSNVKVLGIDKVFLMRFGNIGSRKQNDGIYDFINILGPYIQGEINSEILEVMQTGILNILGYELPFDWREQSFHIIRIYFLRPFIFRGVVNLDLIYDMLRIQEYLIPRNYNYIQYKTTERQFLDDFEYDDRQNHNDEQIAKLLRNSKNAFYNFGDNSNSGGVI